MSLDALALGGLRGLAGVAGVLLLYAALFLYPDERRELLQNRLEDWWVRLDDLRESALAGQLVLVREMAHTAHCAFQWLLGEPLSTRFCALTGLLSMASFCLAMSLFGDYGWAVPTGMLFFALGTGFFIVYVGRSTDQLNQAWRRERERRLSSLLELQERLNKGPAAPHSRASRLLSDMELPAPDYDSFPSDYTRQAEPSLWERTLNEAPLIFLVLVLASSTGLVLSGAQEQGVGAGPFFFAMLAAFVSDFASVLVTMSVLEKLSEVRSAVAAGAWLLLDAIAAGAMLLAPLGLFWWMEDKVSPVATFLVFVASANVSTALPSAVYALAAAVLLAHRLFWPLLLRPFYNLVHAERLARPRLLATAGVVCLVAAWPRMLEPLRPIAEKVTSLL